VKGNRIVFVAPEQAELQSYQIPEISNADDVLVKTVVSTISPGTERAVLSDSPNCGGYERHVFPRQSGYSSAGTVLATGTNVNSIKLGDRVVVYWGKHSCCNLVPEKQVIKIPDNVSFEEAAVAFIASFPLAAIRKCRLEIGESSIVMGCGLLGQLAVKLLHAAGSAPIIAADLADSRRNEALCCGADAAFDPKDESFAQRVKDFSCGGARVGIEVTGFGAGLDEALNCMTRFGRIALLGCTRNSDFSIDYYHKVHMPGITLVGAHTVARPEYDSAPGWFTQRDDVIIILKLLSMGRITFLDMLSDRSHSPANCADVYDCILHDKSFPVLTQFDWRML
jgi:2-desacetyl-2-hydroxyethyl bacteriochlorophyllide A dehydrogenase